MHRHAPGLAVRILVVAGIFTMNVAWASDSNGKETATATTHEALGDRRTRREGTITRIRHAALFDPCLVRIDDDRFGILCSVSPALTRPRFALRCLGSAGTAWSSNARPMVVATCSSATMRVAGTRPIGSMPSTTSVLHDLRDVERSVPDRRSSARGPSLDGHRCPQREVARGDAPRHSARRWNRLTS